MGYVREASQRRASVWSLDLPEAGADLWAFIEQMDPDYRGDHDGLGPGDIWGNDPLRGAARRTTRRLLAGAALFVGGMLADGAVAGDYLHAPWLPGIQGWRVTAVAWGGLLTSVAGLALLAATLLTALLKALAGFHAECRGRVRARSTLLGLLGLHLAPLRRFVIARPQRP